VRLYLVHHGDAVGPDVDVQRPLSARGRIAVDQLAQEAAAREVRPDVVWHSGKLRCRQTAQAFWRACNALAECSASRDLQPDDPPGWMADRVRGETRDILIAGKSPVARNFRSLSLSSDWAKIHFTRCTREVGTDKTKSLSIPFER
jgi:phosphohistidine phosphatase